MNRILFAGIGDSKKISEGAIWELMTDCQQHSNAGLTVESVMLPLSWERSYGMLGSRLMENWDAVILIAEKPSPCASVERLALNEADISLADAKGGKSSTRVICEDGDPGYWTGLPFRELVINMTKTGIIARSSHSAGSFVPNAVFYRMMHWISKNKSNTVGGLIHLPSEGENSSPLTKLQQKAFIPSIIDVLTKESVLQSQLSVKLSRERIDQSTPARTTETTI